MDAELGLACSGRAGGWKGVEGAIRSGLLGRVGVGLALSAQRRWLGFDVCLCGAWLGGLEGAYWGLCYLLTYLPTYHGVWGVVGVGWGGMGKEGDWLMSKTGGGFWRLTNEWGCSWFS